MSVVPYETFLPYVIPYAPHCLEDQAVLAVRSACIDFCRDTQLLQEDLDPFSAQAGVANYELYTTGASLVTQVLALYYLTRKLERKSPMELQSMYSRNWQSITGTPQVFTMPTQTSVTVVPYPEETVAGAFSGRIAVVPSRASTGVDSVLFERYVDAIAAGALARLKMTPDQPYTDLPGAQLQWGLFRSSCAATRSFVNGGMNRASMRVRFNRIW